MNNKPKIKIKSDKTQNVRVASTKPIKVKIKNDKPQIQVKRD